MSASAPASMSASASGAASAAPSTVKWNKRHPGMDSVYALINSPDFPSNYTGQLAQNGLSFSEYEGHIICIYPSQPHRVSNCLQQLCSGVLCYIGPDVTKPRILACGHPVMAKRSIEEVQSLVPGKCYIREAIDGTTVFATKRDGQVHLSSRRLANVASMKCADSTIGNMFYQIIAQVLSDGEKPGPTRAEFDEMIQPGLTYTFILSNPEQHFVCDQAQITLVRVTKTATGEFTENYPMTWGNKHMRLQQSITMDLAHALDFLRNHMRHRVASRLTTRVHKPESHAAVTEYVNSVSGSKVANPGYKGTDYASTVSGLVVYPANWVKGGLCCYHVQGPTMNLVSQLYSNLPPGCNITQHTLLNAMKSEMCLCYMAIANEYFYKMFLKVNGIFTNVLRVLTNPDDEKMRDAMFQSMGISNPTHQQAMSAHLSSPDFKEVTNSLELMRVPFNSLYSLVDPDYLLLPPAATRSTKTITPPTIAEMVGLFGGFEDTEREPLE